MKHSTLAVAYLEVWELAEAAATIRIRITTFFIMRGSPLWSLGQYNPDLPKSKKNSK